MRHLVWFSCGANSAVAAKRAVEKYGNACEVIYCDLLATEHPGNLDFLRSVETWIDRKIVFVRSEKYSDIDDVFMRTRYMAGIAGARCTVEMKKLPREQFQRCDDVHIFGYTFDEQSRALVFETNNPSLFVEWILIDEKITKQECFETLATVGIAIPEMYRLGFKNNNCIGCVKASSPGYWNRTRRHFPEVFKRRAEQSRTLGVRLVVLKGERIFLDELPESADALEDDIDCGPVCQMRLF